MHVQHVHIDISHSITLNVSLKTHTDIEKTKENAKTKTKCFEWKRDSDNQHCSDHVILFLSLYSILFFSPLLLLLLLVDVRCTQSTVCMCVWMDGWMYACAIDINVWNITSTKAIAVSQQIWALELSSQTEWIEHTQSIVLWIAFYICTESWLPFFLHRLNRFCTLIRSKLLLVLSF